MASRSSWARWSVEQRPGPVQRPDEGLPRSPRRGRSSSAGTGRRTARAPGRSGGARPPWRSAPAVRPRSTRPASSGQIALVLARVVVVQHVGEQPPPAVELAPGDAVAQRRHRWPPGRGRARSRRKAWCITYIMVMSSGPSAVAACPGSVSCRGRPARVGEARTAGEWGTRSSWQRPSPGPVHPDIGKPPQILRPPALAARRLNFGRTSYVVVVMATISYDVRRFAVPVAAMLLLSACSGGDESSRATRTPSPAPTTSAPSEPSPTASRDRVRVHEPRAGAGDRAEAVPRLAPRVLRARARRRRPPPRHGARADGGLHVVRRVVPQRAPAGDRGAQRPHGQGAVPGRGAGARLHRPGVSTSPARA